MFQPDKLADLIAGSSRPSWTIEHLVSWLEREGEKTFDWMKIHDCLLCRWAVSQGHEDAVGSSGYSRAMDELRRRHGYETANAIQMAICNGSPSYVRVAYNLRALASQPE